MKVHKIMRINSITAWVTVEGDNGSEKSIIYDMEGDDSGVAGWIASKGGQRFQVHSRDGCQVRREETLVRLVIDGHVCDEEFRRKRTGSKADKYDKKTVSFTGYSISDTAERDYEFSELIRSDDEEYLDIPKCETMGTIGILWYNASEADDTAVKKDLECKDLPEEQIVAHEQQHKDGTHHTRMGEERTVPARAEAPNAKTHGDPFATFLFEYAPIELLQANGHVPRSKGQKGQGAETENDAQRSDSGSDVVEVDAPYPAAERIKTEQNVERIPEGGLEDVEALTALEEKRRAIAQKRQELEAQEEEIEYQIRATKRLKTNHPIPGPSKGIKIEADVKLEMNESAERYFERGGQEIIDLT